MKAIIITGLSGAGKTQAMDCLEDMGYYCIDNMPPALIKSFIDLTASGKGIDKAAFVIDVRGGQALRGSERFTGRAAKGWHLIQDPLSGSI